MARWLKCTHKVKSNVKSSLEGFLVLSVGYRYFHFYKQFVQTSMYCSKVVVTAVDQKLRELRTLKQHYYPEVITGMMMIIMMLMIAATLLPRSGHNKGGDDYMVVLMSLIEIQNFN